MNIIQELEKEQMKAVLAKRHGIPFAITLAGGYARRVEDTVQIHVNTLMAARDYVRR